MLVNLDNWKEIGRNDVVISQQIDIAPFHIYIEVAEDYRHDWLFKRGELSGKHRKGAIENVFATHPEEKYYHPAYKAHQQVKHLVQEKGYTVEAATQVAQQRVKDEMYIALSHDHCGYSAYVILVTVRMRVNTPDLCELITLATRSITGVEVEELPSAIATIRAEAAEMGFEVKPATPEYMELDAITAQAEKTARRALDASIAIIRHFRYDMRLNDLKPVIGQIMQSASDVPDSYEEHMEDVQEIRDRMKLLQ